MIDFTVPQITSALIASTVAAVTAISSIILQIVFRVLDYYEKKNTKTLENRQETLLSALQVIDNVFANTSFEPAQKNTQHEWDITLAREAMNKMLIYCANPKRTVNAFTKAIGVHNSQMQKAPKYGPKDLAEFRKIVCEELYLPVTNYDDANITWIYRLPGTEKECKR